MARMPGRGVLWVVAGATALRLVLAGCIGPGNDEAYYSLYLDHLDWSFFDHPPMVALVAGLGRWLWGGQGSIASLRLGFVLVFAGSTLLIARIARRAFGEQSAAPTALALNGSLYFGTAVGTFILPDGPLLFFWLLTIDRLISALGPGRRVLPWIGVGLAWGGAMLSKYHAVLLPIALLTFVLIEPRARRILRTPGPYLAATIGLVMFSPVIAWNARNAWASFAFQGARAASGFELRPGAMLGSLAAQAFYLLPWIAISLAVLLVRVARRPAADPLARFHERFFLAFAVIPIGFFTMVSLFKPVLPHWGLIGAVGFMPVLGASWADRMKEAPRASRRRLVIIAGAPVVVTALAIAQARTGWLQEGRPGPFALIPTGADPTRDLVGWDRIALELRRRGLLDRPGTFVFTGHWHISGQLSRAIGPSVPVLCYREGDARGFASWSRPTDWVGHDGILVAVDDRSTEPQCFDRWFEQIELVARFDIERGGIPIRPVRVFLCHRQTRPFPFDAPPAGARSTASREDGSPAPRTTIVMQ